MNEKPLPCSECVYFYAFQEWMKKTEFIQEWIISGRLSPKYLGWHRADILRDLIDLDKLLK